MTDAESVALDGTDDDALPWRLHHMVALATVQLMGVAAVVLAWIGASDEILPAQQVPWTSVALLGVIIAAVVDRWWIVTGRRTVRRRLERAMTTAMQGIDSPLWEDTAFVAVRGQSHFHRTTCQLVAGKAATAASRLHHEGAGRTACAMCRP